MKKLLTGVLTCVFCLSLASIAFAGIAEKQAELGRIAKYLNVLDKKIISSRAKRQTAKVNKLRVMKKKELERAKKLRAEIELLKNTTTEKDKQEALKEKIRQAFLGQKAPKQKVVSRPGWQMGLGYATGAANLKLGFVIPSKRFDLLLEGGYSTGDQFSVTLAGLALRFPGGLSSSYFGIDLALANYSAALVDMPLVGNVAQGSNTGIGIFFGNKIGSLQTQFGYNTAVGLAAHGIFKF